MNYEDKLQNVSVLGAAGKMGSGILLLTAVEMADMQLKPENKGKNFILNAIDVSPVALTGLYGYLKTQVKKIAEKKVVQLRGMYKDNSDLIENSEIRLFSYLRPPHFYNVSYPTGYHHLRTNGQAECHMV